MPLYSKVPSVADPGGLFAPPKDNAAVCDPAPPPYVLLPGNVAALDHASIATTLLKVSLVVFYQT